MDPTTSLTTPLGPMTQARLETEVTSLLSQFHFDPLETWLLPQTKMFCVLRYQGTSLEGATERDGHQEHEEEPHTPGRAVLLLKPSKRYYRRAPAPLPLNPTNPCVCMTWVRYYRPCQRYYRSLPGTTALPVRRERA